MTNMDCQTARILLCRTNGPQPTSLMSAEWNKKVERENGEADSAEQKEVAMEGVEVEEKVGMGVKAEKMQKEMVGEEASKMVRWGSSPDSTHLEHC